MPSSDLLDLLCPEHGKFSSSGLTQSVSEKASSGVPASRTAFPNNLCSLLLGCTGCVLPFPNTALQNSELVLGLLPLCSSFQGVPPLGERPGKERKCGSFTVEEMGEKRAKGWNSVLRLRRCPACLQQDVQLRASPGRFCASGSGSETEEVWLKLSVALVVLLQL